MDIYFYLSLAAGLLLMILERILPARALPQVNGWWSRVIILNVIQAGIIVGLGDIWIRFFSKTSVFELATMNNWMAASIGYLVVTFVYYWWHRWRHRVYFLWVTMHQIHHSARRIETITSFYKHPFEILVNSFIVSGLAYGLLGLSPLQAAILNFMTAIAEFLYHMNIKTPHWLGYIFQRPESHRIHHQLSKHDKNFSDLPIWDMLFGTFYNPKEEVQCGFKPERESQLLKMLLFKDVNQPLRRKS